MLSLSGSEPDELMNLVSLEAPSGLNDERFVVNLNRKLVFSGATFLLTLEPDVRGDTSSKVRRNDG